MPSKISNPKPSRLRLSLPATSANLGPAFDAAALAMDFYIKIDARASEQFSIRASGRDREICGKFEDHLILNTYREVLRTPISRSSPCPFASRTTSPSAKAVGLRRPPVWQASLWLCTWAVCGGLMLKSSAKRPAANTIPTMHPHAGWVD